MGERSDIDVTQLVMINEEKRQRIKDDELKGRPILKIQMGMLTRRGAIVNVISKNVIEKLGEMEISKTEEKLRCANSSEAEVRGKARIKVQVGMKTQKFLVVEQINLEIIGGIDMQKKFQIELQ